MLTSQAQVYQPEAIRATIHVGTERVDYWSAGRGSPLLLLHASDASADPDLAWLSALTSRFRVLVPSLVSREAGADQPIATRLRSFLDGLGLARVAVAADVEAAAEVLWLALSEPERIDRVVIVLSEHADPVCPEGLSPDRFVQSRQPILIVRKSLPDPGSSSAPAGEYGRMLRFLSGDG